MTTTPLPPEPAAAYTLSIAADTGYKSTTEGRCNVQQYAAAVRALHDAAWAKQVAEGQQAPPDPRPVIEMCAKALAEELAAWDIEPPLHHVKEASDACEAWLAAAPVAQQQAEAVPDVRSTLNRFLADKGVYLSKESIDDFMRRLAPQQAEAVPSDVARDAERLDWLLMQVSGKEFKRIGVEYSGNCQRSDVDAAIAQQKGPQP